MEAVLMLAQISFYLTVSAVFAAIGIMCAMITYHLIRIVKELEKLSSNLNYASSEAGERINNIIERLSDLPVLSYFLKKQAVLKTGKGRSKNK